MGAASNPVRNERINASLLHLSFVIVERCPLEGTGELYLDTGNGLCCQIGILDPPWRTAHHV